MSRATLKRSLGEANAYFDDANGGADNLLAILAAMAASSGESVSFREPTPTTGVKSAIVADTPTTLANIYARVGVAGTAGTTTLAVLVNGESVATLSVGNAEADGTAKGVAINRAIEPGDVVELSITAVATGATNVVATARLKPVTVEA